MDTGVDAGTKGVGWTMGRETGKGRPSGGDVTWVSRWRESRVYFFCCNLWISQLAGYITE